MLTGEETPTRPTSSADCANGAPDHPHAGLEREGPAERFRGLAGARWHSALFPRERESIALLLRLNLKEVKLKPHKKYDYYKMLKPLPGGHEPCCPHPCLG